MSAIDPEKLATPQRAYLAVRVALEKGHLIRPDSCQRCNAPNTPCSDGRSRIQAHHHDYSKPLDVEWICAACHRRDTPLPTQPRPDYLPPNTLFTGEAVLNARRLRQLGWTYPAIARLYGVHKNTARQAVVGITWKYLPASSETA